MLRNKSCSFSFLFTLGALAITLIAGAAVAQTYTVINTFEGTNGAQPMDGLIFDQAGNNLYGTTLAGGYGKGVVFELSPNGSGGWTETVLYAFSGKDGANPYASVVFDTEGNLYGTTEHGGVHDAGVVFELSPAKGGGWTERVLYSFGSGIDDGSTPIAGLSFDASGNLYGTTYLGGNVRTCTYSGATQGCGTVFELSPTTGYSIIHNFSNVNDGSFPVAGVTYGPSGYLYGEASSGDTYSQGLLYDLIPNGNGTWTEKSLHVWGRVHDGRPDGGYPYSSVIFDSFGYMYGTSNVGGTHGDLGTVFRFTQGNGGWGETNIHGFGNSPQGSYPESALYVDAADNLYGTTYQGGTGGDGTVYELIPVDGGEGGWTYKQLYNFTGAADGALPTGGLIMDSAGNLYGTAPYGGDATHCLGGPVQGCGVVYKITPN